jgi:hypothetical protein
MSRLVHSRRGFRRYMQVSQKQLFTFVEGKSSDRNFYGRLCAAVCKPLNASYEQVMANQLPGGGTGGKTVLIGFFKYLRRSHSLVTDLLGKRTAALFFLDKDIDDLLGKLLRSEHCIYTQHYHVENYLFRESNLVNAVGAAASLGPEMIEPAVGDPEAMLRNRAALWKDWVKLCVLAQKRRIRTQSNYGVTSQINNPPNAPTDPAALNARLAQMHAASGLTAIKFQRARRSTSRLVERLYERGEHDRVFKGKWYALILERDIRDIAPGQPIQANFAHRLMGAVAAAVDYTGPWADELKGQIAAVLRRSRIP